MKSLNEVRLIGNVCADPEVKETQSGIKVATFSIATNKVWKDSEGNKQEKVTYHKVVLWKGLAEIADKYVSKGSPVFIAGEIDNRSWDKPDGTKGYISEIVANDLILLGSKGSGTTGMEVPPEFMTAEEKAAAAKNGPKIEEEISIEDIPF